MNAREILSEQVVAGWLLIVSALIFLVAGFLFTARVIWQWPSAQSKSFLYWERGIVMADILVVTLGLVLLAQLLQGAGDRIVPPLALTIFLIAAVLVLVAESFGLHEGAYIYVPIVISVILAFIGQALFGVAILRSGFLPGWVGWATIIWNLAWLVILPIARPQDMYYPWLHYVAPLIIGIALLSIG
ncbi:MAG: hypothetical protein H6659_06905 [Ardenticatenaceae bacterium]|nr:hypothetical protein [Ardenticatenaceae bacterium]